MDINNRFRTKNLSCLVENRNVVCKSYVDVGLKDPSIIKKTHLLTSMIKISITFDLLN